MFTLSPAAAAEIRAAMPRSGADGLALRIAARVETDGAMAFGMGFDEQREGDLPLEIDGVQLLSPTQFNVEQFDLERIEFLKGPQGAVYGQWEQQETTAKEMAARREE